MIDCIARLASKTFCRMCANSRTMMGRCHVWATVMLMPSRFASTPLAEYYKTRYKTGKSGGKICHDINV